MTDPYQIPEEAGSFSARLLMRWVLFLIAALVYVWSTETWWLFPPVFLWMVLAPPGVWMAPGAAGLIILLGPMLQTDGPWNLAGHGVILSWSAGWLVWRLTRAEAGRSAASAPDAPGLPAQVYRWLTIAAVTGLAAVLLVRHIPLIPGLALAALVFTIPASAGRQALNATWGAWIARLQNPTRREAQTDGQPGAGWRRFAATALLLLLSAGLSLGVLETGARILELAPEYPHYYPHFKKHPEYIITLNPNTRVHFPFHPTRGVTEDFFVEISSQGLRDREYGPKEEGEFRILMLGDSYAHGHGLDWEEAPPQALEQRLHQSGFTNVTVINAGVTGTGPWQQRGFLRERGFPLEPDLVLHQIFLGNDILDTVIGQGGVLDTYEPWFMQNLLFYRHRPAWQIKIEHWLTSHSHAYSALLHAAGSRKGVVWLMDQLRPFSKPDYPELPPPAPRPFYTEASLEEWYPELEEGWELMQADVLGTKEDCVERGVEYAVFLVSGLYTWCDNAWNEAMNAVEDGSVYERGKEIRVAKAFFEEQDLPYVPLNAALAEHPNPANLYFPFDMHFNAEGARFVAQVIEDYLVEQELLP